MFSKLGLYPKREYEYDTNGNLIYEGFANSAANIDDFAWLILKHSYDDNNNRIATKLSNNEVKYNKQWVNKINYSYTDLLDNNQAPIIDNISWNNTDQYENNSYTLTISAYDPNIGDTLNYNINCNDPNINISQNTIYPNKFTIIYPEYTDNISIQFLITVTDNRGLFTSSTVTQLVKNITISRGVFGGGNDSSENTIDYIIISTLGDALDFGDLTYPANQLAATSNGINNRGIFGGGSSSNIINYITISTLDNALDFGDLTIAKSGLVATSNNTNNRGVFGGGYDNNYSNIISYITISTLGDALDFGDLTITSVYLAATSNGTNERGIFGGGSNSSYLNIVDYITISTLGNALDFGDLTNNAANGISATSNEINNRGVFGGGQTNTISYITISTLGDALDFGDLTIERRGLAATSNGTNERGVFGGGSSYGNTIDYITISTLDDALDFGDLSTARYWLAATSNA